MSAVTIQQMADRVAQLLEERLGLGGRGLSVKLKRAGRTLPKKVRDSGRVLAQAAQKGQNPKLLGQIDMADRQLCRALGQRQIQRVRVAIQRRANLREA